MFSSVVVVVIFVVAKTLFVLFRQGATFLDYADTAEAAFQEAGGAWASKVVFFVSQNPSSSTSSSFNTIIPLVSMGFKGCPPCQKPQSQNPSKKLPFSITNVFVTEKNQILEKILGYPPLHQHRCSIIIIRIIILSRRCSSDGC